MHQCQSCSFEHYATPKISVQIILENNKGEFLLLRRSQEFRQGTLNTPGGFIECGETAEQAALRETEEETGIKIKKIEYIGSYPDVYSYQDINWQILTLAFYAYIGKSKVKANDESAEVLFYSKNKVPYRELGIPSDTIAIKDYLKRFK